MICIKADIPKELNEIDDELKAIYHSKDTVCFYIFKTRDLRNEFVDNNRGMDTPERDLSIHRQCQRCISDGAPEAALGR